MGGRARRKRKKERVSEMERKEMEGKRKVCERRMEEDTEENCKGNAGRKEKDRRTRERQNEKESVLECGKNVRAGKRKQKVESQLTWT